MVQVAQYVRAVPRDNFSVFSGDDATAVPYMSVGARGLISTISNLIPEQMVALVHAMLAGSWEQARVLHHELFPLFEAAMLESNPMPIKAMMQLCGKPQVTVGHLLVRFRHQPQLGLIVLWSPFRSNTYD